MTSSLTQQHIWLIGASHGIGEALAERLIRNSSAKVTISARSEDKLNEMATRLGERCVAIPCDVSDKEDVTKAYKRAIDAQGPLDMLIYCAGLYDPMSAAEFDLAKVEQMIEVNQVGAVRAVHTVLPDFKERGSGHIALFGSVAGFRGLPKAMGYGMTKAAMIHLAENLRQDVSDMGIFVHIINPGFVKTRLTDKNDFDMPFRISTEKAAEAIVSGLESNRYDIHFPKRFTWMMKAFNFLPHSWYFWLCSKL